MDELEKIISENTKNIKNKEDRKNSEKWLRAYYEISKETGISLKETVNHSYCFVKSERVCGRKSLFGRIGVYERSDENINYFRFGRKIVGFDSRKDEIYWARNVIMLLKEREKYLNSKSLFPMI